MQYLNLPSIIYLLKDLFLKIYLKVILKNKEGLFIVCGISLIVYSDQGFDTAKTTFYTLFGIYILLGITDFQVDSLEDFNRETKRRIDFLEYNQQRLLKEIRFLEYNQQRMSEEMHEKFNLVAKVLKDYILPIINRIK